jgi:hypothetical protein
MQPTASVHRESLFRSQGRGNEPSTAHHVARKNYPRARPWIAHTDGVNRLECLLWPVACGRLYPQVPAHANRVLLVILTSRCFIVPGSYANQRQTRDKNSISHCSGVSKSMLSIPRAHTTRRQPLGYPSHPVGAPGHLCQLSTHNTPHWRADWALCVSIRRATESCRPTGIRAPARHWTPPITCSRACNHDQR